jgi:hypothetical protein
MTPNQTNLVTVFLPTNQTIEKQNSLQPVSNIIQFSNRPTFHPR